MGKESQIKAFIAFIFITALYYYQYIWMPTKNVILLDDVLVKKDNRTRNNTLINTVVSLHNASAPEESNHITKDQINGSVLIPLKTKENPNYSSNNHVSNEFILNTEDQIPYKIFKKWNNQFPCFESHWRQDRIDGNFKGLLYIKVPKTGSSTLSGINQNIAHRHASSYENKMIKACSATYRHHPLHKLNLKNTSKSETFLWTVVREPASQLISSFFFFIVGRKKKEANLENFKSTAKFDTQIQYTSPRTLSLNDSNTEEQRRFTTQEIINEYDFMGVTERMDETLVALRFILGLDAGDILYVSGKVSGGYSTDGQTGKCVKIPPSILPDDIKNYTLSQEFNEKLLLPKLLYHAANKSLDLTIRNIGEEKFAKALEEHRYLMSLVSKICAPKAIFPCFQLGKRQKASKQDCYWADSGCGYRCLNELYLNYTNMHDKTYST